MARIVRDRIDSNLSKARIPKSSVDIMSWDDVAHNLNMQDHPESGNNNTATNCRAIQTSALWKCRMLLMDDPFVRDVMKTSMGPRSAAWKALHQEWTQWKEDEDVRNALT